MRTPHYLLNEEAMPFTKADFGDGFAWGTSTAAYQIEGSHRSDGKGPSIWDTFCAVPRKILNKETGNDACDHYCRYEHDLDLMQAMGLPHYRFSTAWSRILPAGTGAINYKGLDFYDRLVDAMLERNITPWTTLYHWDLPQALEQKGGWTNRDVLRWFEDYCHIVTKRLGDRVKNWMVMNEPMVFTGAGYFLGVHAPGRRGFKNFIPAMLHASLAMPVGGQVVRNMVKGANLGTTFSASYIEPIDAKEKNLLAARRVDALLNRLYLEPVLGKGYPLEDLKPLQAVEKYMKPGDPARMAFDFDFIGLQVYTREKVRHSFWTPYLNANLVEARKRGVPTTLMNWEVYPPSIYQLIKQYDAHAGIKKIIVTENGAAFADQVVDGQVIDVQRTAYLREHLQQVLKAKNEGAKVDGYFVWTFMDNFEWAEGYRPRFGLVHVDFATQQRIIKQSGYWFAKLMEAPLTVPA